MHFFVRAKVKKPREVTNKEFFGVWQRESVAGRELAKQGVPIFKVVGKYEVVFIAEVASEAELDEAIHALPIWQEGYQDIIELEVEALRPYADWGQQLDKLAAG